MRGIWPPIIFISTALHLIVGAAILLPSSLGTGEQIASGVAAANAEPVTMLLRSQDVLGKSLSALRLTSQPMTMAPAAVPIAAINAASRPVAPEVPALALRDKARAHVRLVSQSTLDSALASAADSKHGVVFVLDISGSMYEPYGDTTRLALARQILGDEIRQLKEGTPFALVVYGETARRSGPLVPANDTTRGAALDFVAQEFNCGGGTNLPVGLALAGELHMGAVVVVTDGDLNMKPAELLPKARQILGAAGSRPALTVVAIGPRPHTDAQTLLQELAQQQGGTYETDNEVNLAAALAAKSADVAAK